MLSLCKNKMFMLYEEKARQGNIFSHVSSTKLSPYLLETGSFKRCHYFYTV